MGAHAKYGTYLLNDGHMYEADKGHYEPDAVAIRHVNGRKFLTEEQRVALGYPVTGPGVRVLSGFELKIK
jgi:hypothetical protein